MRYTNPRLLYFTLQSRIRGIHGNGEFWLLLSVFSFAVICRDFSHVLQFYVETRKCLVLNVTNWS